MQIPEAVKTRLQSLRRNQRTIASTMENNQISFAILMETTTDHSTKAAYRVAHGMGASLIDECRSIANVADECLRRDEISYDELVDLAMRANRVSAKFNALLAELSKARQLSVAEEN